MAKRLVKIAKELNVGTTTIVDHLINNGFEIENKPTAKVTEAMEAELLKEFQKSIAIKEQADQLIIGNRPVQKKEASPVAKTAVVDTPPPPPPPPPIQKKVEPEPVVIEEPVPEVKEEPVVEKTAPVVGSGLKVVGKIDLDAKSKAKPKKEKKEEEKEKKEVIEPVEETPPTEVVEEVEIEQPPVEEAPAAPVAKEEVKEEKEVEPEVVEEVIETPPVDIKEETKKEEEPVPVHEPKQEEEKETPAPVAVVEEKQEETPVVTEEVEVEKAEAKTESEEGEETDAPKSDKLTRAETPELRGLKILGKIDTDKFKRPKKKKKEKEKPKPKPKPAAKANVDKNAKGGPADGKKEVRKDGKPGEKKTEKKPSSDQDERRKRRRTRRRVSAPGGNNNNRNQRGSNRNQPSNRSRRDDVKEVSQKEIDEKIKATMARMSGGGKKKRQRQRRDNRERLRERQEMREQEKTTDKLQLTEFVSVSELASLMDVAVTDVIMTCMNLGVIVSINQRLDAEIIELVAEEFGHEVEFISIEEQVDEEVIIEDDPADLSPRAPIVTVMGHVDHGKTSLLDYIREANVASGEAGGITQHIGAYEVVVGEENKKITFLDTPGHEAFTAMRARGAKVTDIAVIIVAADDRIMPQTKEAISHAQAAGVPIVFAINKIDKPGAEPERIKQELASLNFLVEAWGGSYQSQDISAKTGEHIDLLLEKILLEAELLELQANPDREAVGAVLEASLDKGRGYVTKMLVQTGTMNIGDSIVAGEHSGKVKAMFNERGKRIKQAGPSTPVLVLGLSGAPQAGERFKEVDSEQEARQIAAKRAQIVREQTTRATKRISLDEIGRRLALGNFKELNLIVKGDVDGSVEALSDSLIKLSIETVQVNVIHKAVGQIIESDVLLATASDAIIIGFQVRPSIGARRLAEKEGVEIKTYSIIYEAIEELKLAIEGMLEPTKEEKITAQVEVREIYKISKVGTIAGCYVQEGVISRNSHIRLIRNGIVVYPVREGAHGEVSSLKRFKDDAKEVKTGLECGLSIKNFNDIKVGDVVEGYEIVEIKQKLK